MKNYLNRESPESMKRLIAFMCSLVMILEVFVTFFVTLTDNQLKLITNLNDSFMYIILLTLFFTTIEKFDITKVFKK